MAHQILELTRKARIYRLCTRGGMLESFLICPGELTDDQVMELLTLSFRQQVVALALANKNDSRFAKGPEHSRPFIKSNPDGRSLFWRWYSALQFVMPEGRRYVRRAAARP